MKALVAAPDPLESGDGRPGVTAPENPLGWTETSLTTEFDPSAAEVGEKGLKVFDGGRRRNVPIKEGRWQLVQRRHLVPPLLSKEAYLSLDSFERHRYDRARQSAHRGIDEIRTPQMRLAHMEMQSHLAGADGCPPIARSGTLVSGPPQMGKTTTVTLFARDKERELRDEYGWGRTSTGAEFVPVVYLPVGKGSGTRAFMRKALDFYGLKWRDGWSVEHLTARFGELAYNCGTQMLLLDQLQNFDMSHQGDREVSAHIKELMDVCGLTIFGMGVDLERTGFITEGKTRADAAMAQIGGRFSLVRVEPMGITTKEEREEWRSLLRTIEDKVLLFDKRRGDLMRDLATYVYEETGGIIGDVMSLLTRGANLAIEKYRRKEIPEERITREVLAEIGESAQRRRDRESW